MKIICDDISWIYKWDQDDILLQHDTSQIWGFSDTPVETVTIYDIY